MLTVLLCSRVVIVLLLVVVRFEACCQWALLSVQITRLLTSDTTLLLNLLYISMYPSVSKVHVGSLCVSVIHQTLSLTWTTGSLACVHYMIILMHVCKHTGIGHMTASQHNITDWEKNQVFLVLLRSSCSSSTNSVTMSVTPYHGIEQLECKQYLKNPLGKR